MTKNVYARAGGPEDHHGGSDMMPIGLLSRIALAMLLLVTGGLSTASG